MTGSRPFLVELIKPSHYDDDGYVIQWRRAYIPSNSLSSVYGLARDAARRRVLGEDVDIRIEAYDETNTKIPLERIERRFKANDNRGLVCMVGVQSNQFPRAMDIARRFRAAGIPVAIGGFHVSGCLSMLPTLPPDLEEAHRLGISLFAGEAEGRLEGLFKDVLDGKLEPTYNYLHDLPDLQDQPTPFLPATHIRKYGSSRGCFDAGRGCPFTCSFCTIINVQGRKSRFRSPDDIEHIIREHADQGVTRYFITDDNFARNKDWEAIFDRMIEMREVQGVKISCMIQVDTLCHLIPNFVEKAARAGCRQVFIGLENINPANLQAASKGQNRITEYRRMLQAWRDAGVVNYCGYILGFPGDTPESIERDLEIVKRELPVDLLEFFILTPLPGSEDHRRLDAAGTWMNPDMNIYDLEHVTTGHPEMSPDVLADIYRRAWDIYYTPKHIETLLRRAVASGSGPGKLADMIVWFYGSVRFERVHPLQAGIVRIKDRRQRRPGMPVKNPLVFYPERAWNFLCTAVRYYRFYREVRSTLGRIVADPQSTHYRDVAITPVIEAEDEHLEMFEVSDAARQAVTKAKATKRRIDAAREAQTSAT